VVCFQTVPEEAKPGIKIIGFPFPLISILKGYFSVCEKMEV